MRRSIMALCVFAGIAPTIAQAYGYCSEPSEPSVPNGYYADKYDMERARREVEDYLDELEEYKECLISAAQEADDAAESIIDEWNRAVQQYNSR